MHRPTLIKCSHRNVKIVPTLLRDTTTLWDPYPGPPTLEIMQTKCSLFGFLQIWQLDVIFALVRHCMTVGSSQFSPRPP